MEERSRFVGRLFRLVAGVLLVVLAAMEWEHLVQWKNGVAVLGVIAGLFVLYILVHLAVERYLKGVNPWLGALLAQGPLVVVFVFGGFPGQMGVVLYVGVSLILAGLRGDPGCEVMSAPALFFKKGTHLVCLVFTPVDRIEAIAARRGCSGTD